MAQSIEEELSTIQKRIIRLEKAVQIVNRNVLRQTTELRKVLVSIERKLG